MQCDTHNVRSCQRQTGTLRRNALSLLVERHYKRAIECNADLNHFASFRLACLWTSHGTDIRHYEFSFQQLRNSTLLHDLT